MQLSNLVGVDDPKTILRPLANHLRPMLINSLKARRKAVFTENADRIKRLLDNLQRKLDEVSAIIIYVLSTFCVCFLVFFFFWGGGYRLRIKK